MYTTADGLNDEVSVSDAILIPGNTINPDGSLSERLKNRLDKACQLHQLKMAKTIVVSGGLGKEGYYEGTEMKKYLITKGIEAESIIIDNLGNTTAATALNYKSIAAENDFNSVIIVSQFYHLTRAKLALKKVGVQNISSAHGDFFELRDIYSLLREFPAYYKYLLF